MACLAFARGLVDTNSASGEATTTAHGWSRPRHATAREQPRGETLLLTSHHLEGSSAI